MAAQTHLELISKGKMSMIPDGISVGNQKVVDRNNPTPLIPKLDNSLNG